MASGISRHGILTQDNYKKAIKKRKWDFREDSYIAQNRNQVEIVLTDKTKHWWIK